MASELNGDQYFRATPQFETGDACYSCLIQSIFVAGGRIALGGAEYKVYRVAYRGGWLDSSTSYFCWIDSI